VSIILCGITGRKPDCGRTLQQSQPACAQCRGFNRTALIPAWGGGFEADNQRPPFPTCRKRPNPIVWGRSMFDFQDLFQWDRFITPTIIKTFYWLVIALIVLFGISGIFSGLAAMAISPFGGFLVVLSSIASVVVGVVFSRIVAEFILIVFRINEHLGAIRDQGGMR
jgi:Domain of unknown function (DUF4282)